MLQYQCQQINKDSPSVFSVSWNKDLARSMCTLLKFFRGYESHLTSGIANDYASFLHTLYITLVVATDAVSNCDEREISFVKGVASLGSKLDHALSELVVVLLLLHGVVESRMAKVFFSVGNKKLLKLTKNKIKTSCETIMKEAC